MKKALIICLCLIMVFLAAACRGGDTASDAASSLESEVSSVVSQDESESSDTDNSSSEISSTQSTVSNDKDDASSKEVSSKEETSSEETASKPLSYRDVVCKEIYAFHKVAFSVPGSETFFFMTVPLEWELAKNESGYAIVSNSKVIGSIASMENTVFHEESVNVFYAQIDANGMSVTHSIDNVGTEDNPNYIRTLSFYYYDDYAGSKTIVVRVPYEEMDSAAVYRMMSEVRTSVFTEQVTGTLKQDTDRTSVLILGNSFVGFSEVGTTLQEMCGSKIYVDVVWRSNAAVRTYSSDAEILQKIRSGNYSTVFMCGLYGYSDVLELSNILEACTYSNTKLAIFPAHNESRSLISTAVDMYPNAVLLDWKAEIDNLISTGIDLYEFCFEDDYNHSSPLAGYVGAHMMYRALFNEIPKATNFTKVHQEEIELLGDYITSGEIAGFDNSSIYVIE